MKAAPPFEPQHLILKRLPLPLNVAVAILLSSWLIATAESFIAPLKPPARALNGNGFPGAQDFLLSALNQMTIDRSYLHLTLLAKSLLPMCMRACIRNA